MKYVMCIMEDREADNAEAAARGLVTAIRNGDPIEIEVTPIEDETEELLFQRTRRFEL